MDEGDRIGMLEAAHQIGFLLEALPSLGFTEEVFVHHLDDDGLAGAFVLQRAKYTLPNAAFCQGVLDEVVILQTGEVGRRRNRCHTPTVGDGCDAPGFRSRITERQFWFAVLRNLGFMLACSAWEANAESVYAKRRELNIRAIIGR